MYRRMYYSEVREASHLCICQILKLQYINTELFKTLLMVFLKREKIYIMEVWVL